MPMNENLENAKHKFQQWLHLFQRNCEDPRLNQLQKEIEDLNYQITDSGEPRSMGEDAKFQYLSMDAIGLMNFRGDEVVHIERVAFRVPKNYTRSHVDDTAQMKTDKPTTPTSDPALEQEALRIACDKFVVWTSKFKYACIDPDLDFLEQELHTLGFYIEIGESVLVEENHGHNVFMADVTLFRKEGTYVLSEKRLTYNAPPYYQPDARPIIGMPHSAIPMPSSTLFANEDLSWLTTATGATIRWPLPEDDALIAAAQNRTANQ